jgi:transposase InsO family protein
LKERQPTEEEIEVRSAIQTIALEHRRRYGYRRITAELHRRGMHVNHKRVARIMREDNLLGVQPERFVVTTNSNHKLDISQLSQSYETDGRQSAVGGRHHLHPIESGVCLSGGDPR